ncbi:UDP-N-acetylenolpyruvoylglucosamine reductase [Anoxybacter fermentans]|uniref:UDP-N-acetylenolpyruvoylglucosamine reductase n=1 Tax=Anoxybacter fermentans TaxID=1323375 RepID=A0A3Q9HNU4_9FIRM|nr:UDP-N-acetylmuramate dehydrogenase [Anoxybacter fermentans]AZR72125.1 UDP-N-acetylenolpyruvoylglucosamine reductase [Anoxybacter fermentans]
MYSLSKIKKVLCKISGCKIIENAPMSQYTSFKIGGPADLMVEPTNCEGLQKILQFFSRANVPYFVLGKGSNLLVGDRGIRGVVIKMTGLNYIRIEGNRITAGAGVTLAKLASCALESELTGLEFASGIPGTLGGAVVMNAGAYGGEMKDIITQVIAYTPAGEKKVLTNEEIGFGYRKSIFQKNGWIVVEAEMKLKKGDPVEIRAKMIDLNNRRKEKQPLEYPSAGSVFKRPKGYYVGALIEEAGLKGYTIGDAQVSQKHAGFIINRGNATAKDVLSLIRYIQKRVWEMEGVELEPEIRLVGEFNSDED